MAMLKRFGRLGRKLRQFMRCDDGAAALEFALVLPPLSLILVGMFEVSMAMFTQATMEGALREAARFGMTGSVPNAAAREAQIMQIIDDNTYGVVDMSKASITFEVYNSFGNVGTYEPWVDKNGNGEFNAGIDTFTDLNADGIWNGASGVGSSAQVVQYTVQYDWHVMTPFIAPFFGNNGTVKMKASVVIRNEPWLDT